MMLSVLSLPLVLACCATFAQAPTASEWQPLPALGIPRRAIGTALWTEGLSATSAGRFANSKFNGLLTETVYDYWFHTGCPAQWFDWVVPGTDDEPVGEDVQVSWTHMKWSRRYTGGRSFTYLYSSLVPGFLIQTNVPHITLQSREGPKTASIWEPQFMQEMVPRGAAPLAIVVPVEGGKVRVFKQNVRWWEPLDLGRPAEPWVVVVHTMRGIEPDTAHCRGDVATAVLLTLETADVSLRWWPGGLRLSRPGGIGTLGVSTAFEGLLARVTEANWQPHGVAQRARQLVRLLHAYPVRCREWYARDGNWMEIRDEFGYHRWGDAAWQAEDYAPVPPLYAWGELSLGWPRFEGASDTGIQTRFGPYAVCPGRAASYRLPVWTGEYASFPRTDALPEVRDALADSIRALVRRLREDPPAVNAWAPLWDPGAAAAFGAYNLLDDDAKRGLLEVSGDVVRRTWTRANWHRRREILTGLQYYGGGWRSRDPSDLTAVDENSALGSALYGTYVYAKFSGDWALVRDLLPRMWDAERQFEIFNDWAVPMTSSRANVHNSGIDMDTISVAGLFALVRMSEIAGTREQADRAAYLLAKVAPEALLRFTMPRWMDPQGKEPRLYCSGFSEDGPNRGILADDGGVKDALAMMFSWCGQQPEMFRYYLAGAGAEFFRDWERDFYGRPQVNWYEPRVNPNRLYSHVAMRTWVSFAAGWPEAELAADFENARAKAGIHSQAAEAIALYLGRKAPAYLVRWEPARLLGAAYDEQRKALSADVEACATGTVVLRVNASPRSAEVNGVATETEAVDEALPVPRPELGKLIALSIPAGAAHIVVRW